MWRTIFIAFGLMAIILGFECLVIDSASFYASREASMVDFTGNPAPATKEWRPGEWMPWTVLSLGAITVVYAFTLPMRWGWGCSNCS